MPAEVRAGDEFESILMNAFRKAGRRVRRPPKDTGADLILVANDKTCVVQLKVSSEGRRDRLIPLLSQAILQARSSAPKPAIPVAVVAAKRIPPSVAHQLMQFAQLHAPDVGVGVIDAEGLRSFAGPGLKGMDARPPRRAPRHMPPPQRPPDLFSDLNQWMLKILLGQRLPGSLLSVPREPIRNAFHLAEIARVSGMSASRFVNHLAYEGFLDKQDDRLHVVRTDELLERWISANGQTTRDIPARWIIKKDEKQFFASVARYAAKPLPRCCIGLFAAAAALGLGFVHGVPPHLYLERLDFDILQSLGLSLEDADRHADVYIRIPSNKESVFRAAVLHDGLPVSDALQVWLDVSRHPARGREQANEIWRRVLKPLFGKHPR